MRLRLDYLRRLDFSYKGGYLLLAGFAALLMAIPAAAQYREKMLLPNMQTDPAVEARRNTALARQAVTSLGLVALGSFVAVAIVSRNDLARSYAKAVRDYRNNPSFAIEAPPANPLAGLPPQMLVNMQGRKSAAAPAAPAVVPAAAPSSVGAVRPAIAAAPKSAPEKAVRSGRESDVLERGVFLSDKSGQPPLAAPNARPALAGPEAAFDPSDYAPPGAEFSANWPVFRGPAAGVAEGSLPMQWNGQTGEGVLWKTEIALPGWNSPVVWRDRVFLTGATAGKRKIYCIDAGRRPDCVAIRCRADSCGQAAGCERGRGLRGAHGGCGRQASFCDLSEWGFVLHRLAGKATLGEKPRPAGELVWLCLIACPVQKPCDSAVRPGLER